METRAHQPPSHPNCKRKNEILLQHNSAVQIMQLVTNLVVAIYGGGPAPLRPAPLCLYQIWSILVRDLGAHFCK